MVEHAPVSLAWTRVCFEPLAWGETIFHTISEFLEKKIVCFGFALVYLQIVFRLRIESKII